MVAPGGIAALNFDTASSEHLHVMHIGIFRMCKEVGNPVWIDLARPEMSSMGTMLLKSVFRKPMLTVGSGWRRSPGLHPRKTINGKPGWSRFRLTKALG